MSWLRSPKFCAALVLIAWLAALIAVWGMAAAGRDAIAADTKKACLPKDLQGRALQLELVSSPSEALRVLDGGTIEDSCVLCERVPWLCKAPRVPGGEQARVACIQRGMAAQIAADYLFIPAYSALSLAFFLFAGTFWDAPFRQQTPRKRPLAAWALLVLGVVLALAMAVGDVRENLQLTAILSLAKPNPELESAIGERLPALTAATTLKWGALALSAALLAVFWKSRSSSRLVWVPRIFGLMAAAAIAAGLTVCGWRLVSAGMACLGVLWLAGLIHALAIVVAPEPVS